MSNIREYLEGQGVNFTEFQKAAGEGSPSARTWTDGTNSKKGVGKTSINKMKRLAKVAFKKLKLDDVPESVYEIISWKIETIKK